MTVAGNTELGELAIADLPRTFLYGPFVVAMVMLNVFSVTRAYLLVLYQFFYFTLLQ